VSATIEHLTVALAINDSDHWPPVFRALADADPAVLGYSDWVAKQIGAAVQEAVDAWHAHHPGLLACDPDVMSQ